MNKKVCRKCNAPIPNLVKIDGKVHNLHSRKFCLICSPFGKHNTKRDDPARKAFRGNPYKEWSNEKKAEHIKNVLARGKERKAKLVKLLGGKCKYCGYNKCLRALSFHHIDPKVKLFGFVNLNAKSWKEILEEVKKCELVCVRCHMEIEEGILSSIG